MKKVLIFIFGFLIILSVVLLNCVLITNNIEDDIFGNKFDMFLRILFNILILVSELDWLYNVLYFVCGKKEKHKTVLNVMAGISSLGMFISFLLWFNPRLPLIKMELCVMIFFGLYILIRARCFIAYLMNKYGSN